MIFSKGSKPCLSPVCFNLLLSWREEDMPRFGRRAAAHLEGCISLPKRQRFMRYGWEIQQSSVGEEDELMDESVVVSGHNATARLHAVIRPSLGRFGRGECQPWRGACLAFADRIGTRVQCPRGQRRLERRGF